MERVKGQLDLADNSQSQLWLPLQCSRLSRAFCLSAASLPSSPSQLSVVFCSSRDSTYVGLPSQTAADMISLLFFLLSQPPSSLRQDAREEKCTNG